MYSFTIRKKDCSITLSSQMPDLIALEFAKIMHDFLPNASFDINSICKTTITPTSNHSGLQQTNVIALEQKNEEILEETENITTEDFQKNQDISIEKEITIPKTQTPITQEHSLPVFPNDFAEFLKAKENETLNVIEKKDSELKNAYLQMQNAIKEKNLKKEIDYIVAASYCITHYENQLRFTEEQIKAKIAPFFDEDIDRNFILDAIDKNFIRVIPDFTGFSDTIEYEITQYGEEYFLNEL